MSGGLLPASLIFAALGLALGPAPPYRIGVAAGLTAAAAVVGAVALADIDAASPLRLLIWASLVASAAAGLLRNGLSWPWLLPLVLGAGCGGGAAAGPTTDLLAALAWLWLALPAHGLAMTRGAVVLRVAASWLVTIGLLNAAIPLTTPTPGYVRDHLE